MQRSFRRDLHQIAIAFLVLRQHQQMVVSVAVGRRPFDVVIVFLADIKLAANDGLDARLLGGIHKMHGAENIAVIGHGNRGHAQLFRALAEFVHIAGAVEHRIVSVEMKMNELGHGGSYRLYLGVILTGKLALLPSKLSTDCAERSSLRPVDHSGNWKSTPRSSLAFCVAGISSWAIGNFRAFSAFRIQNVWPTMA